MLPMLLCLRSIGWVLTYAELVAHFEATHYKGVSIVVPERGPVL